MAAGLFSRIKVWIFQEDLASSDLNAEFDNIIDHLDPEYLPSVSQTIAQMQATQNPGTPGAEVLAANLQQEIEELRYKIQQIMGASATEWYSTPPTDLSVIENTFPGLSTFQNGIISGAVDANGQPMFLIAQSATNAVTLKCSLTPLVCYINGTQHTFSTDINLTGLTLGPASNNTATIGTNANGGNYVVGALTKSAGEEDSPELLVSPLSQTDINPIPAFIPLASPGSALTALDGKLVAFKLDNEYSVGYLRGVATRIEGAKRGIFFDSTQTAIPRVGFASADTVTLIQIAYIFLLSGGTLDVTYNQPYIGGQTPSSPATGDYWYNTLTNQWNKYSGTAWSANASVYVGMCAQNSTQTIGARSVDFVKTYSEQASALIKRDSSSVSRAVAQSLGPISVYGQTVTFTLGFLDFELVRDAEESLSSGDYIFLYINSLGKQLVSNIAPHKRPDIGGYYHPSKPYRCIGSAITDGTTISSAVKNISSTNKRASRILSSYFTANITGSTSTTLGTFYFLARGGKVKLRFSAEQAIYPFTVYSTSGSIAAVEIAATVTDEVSYNSVTFQMGNLVSETGAVVSGAAGGFSVDIPQELSGLVKVVISAVTSGGSGTVFKCGTNLVIDEIL